jgi:hypothetical protein
VGPWRVFNIGPALGDQHNNSNIHFWQSQVRPVVSLRLTSLSGYGPDPGSARAASQERHPQQPSAGLLARLRGYSYVGH